VNATKVLSPPPQTKFSKVLTQNKLKSKARNRALDYHLMMPFSAIDA